jgi:hypothetical protein
MRKYLDKGGRALIILGGIGAMFISAWILTSIVQLALALLIGAVTIKMLPVLWQVLTYGQVSSLLAIARNSPVPVLERRKIDYNDNVTRAAKNLKGMIAAREKTLLAHRTMVQRFPDRAPAYQGKIDMIMQGVEYKKRALQKAIGAGKKFDDLLDLARIEWDLQVSINGSLAMQRASDKEVLGKMMENEAFRSIDNELISAFSALEAAMAMDDEAAITPSQAPTASAKASQPTVTHIEDANIIRQPADLFGQSNDVHAPKSKV